MITLDLEVSEALILFGAVEDKKLEASRLAAISTGDEHEIADLSATILGRVAGMIVDALYDEPAHSAELEVMRRLKDPIYRSILEDEIEFGMY